MTTAGPAPTAVLKKVDDLGPPGTPVTTPEVAEGFDYTQRTIYNRLDSLVDDGVLKTKKAGANSRVWWQPVATRSSPDTERDATVAEPPGTTSEDPLQWEPAQPRDGTEQSVPLSEERHRTATEVTSTAVFDWDLVTEGVSVNAHFRDLFGYDVDDEIVGSTLLDERIHPDDREMVSDRLQRAFDPGSDNVYEFEFRAARPDGSERWVLTRGKVFIEGDEDDRRAVRVLGTGVDVTEQKEGQEALRESEARLEAELETRRQLHDISTRSIRENNGDALYDEILDAAVGMLDADFGSLQRLDAEAHELELLTHRGFTPDAVDLWERVGVGSSGSCSRALQTGKRVVVPNVETCEWMEDSEDLEIFRQTGIRAVQTTPLVSRSGEMLGMLSTHWDEPHGPSERDLHLLDVLVREVADLVQQRSAVEALRESEEGYRTLFESIDEGFCIIEVLFDGDDEPIDYRFLKTNPAFEGQTGLTDAEGERMRDLEPNHEEHWFEIYGRIARTGEAERFQNEAKYLGDRWYDVYAFRVGDPEEHTVAVLFDDVSELRHTQRSLERLTVASRELIDADAATVNDRVPELAVDVLEVEYAALWQYNEATGELTEASGATDAGIDADVVRHPDDISEHVWQTFIGDEIAVANDLPVDETVPDGVTLRSRLLVPLGRHGVVCIGSLQPDVFDGHAVDLAETLGATLETAWDRAEGEDRLQRQNEELQRLDRLNTLIREIDQALVGAGTHEGIDESVCERLADSDLYESAWLATYDAETDVLRPQAWAGIDSRYLDERKVTVGDASSHDPLVAAHRTRELQVVPDIAVAARAASWREDALERGARSCVAVPLVYEASMYGILTVHGRNPRPDDRETDVLAELGETIAHAINAVETRETLRTDRVVELTLRTTGANTPLCRLARHLDRSIGFEGLVPGTGGDESVFFTVSGVPAADVLSAVEAPSPFEDLTCLVESENGGAALFRATVTEPTIASLLVGENTVVRSLTVDATAATAVVDVFRADRVGAFLDRLRESLPDLELLARRAQSRPLETRETFRQKVEERLTPRQHEVLLTAYRSGFFESPRPQTGTELADVLDISPSTFTHHLREAERRLCETVFDPA